MYKKKGNLDAAIADFDEALRIEPANSDFYFNRAVTNRAKDHHDHAIDDYTATIQRSGTVVLE